MKLLIRPPQCFYCAKQLEWKDITCPNCGKYTPHLGENWNDKKNSSNDV